MSDINVKIYNQKGEEVGQEKLSAKLFGVKINPVVVQQVVVAQQANARAPIAHTLGRGEVRGGGKKPWKQKGTGRARHGSIRSPLWVGGGVTFGPTSERNFALAVNKKMKRKALAMVLSDKAASGKLFLVDQLDLTEAKTKQLHSVLSALPSKRRKTMIVTDKEDTKVIRSARNLTRTITINVGSLNVVDLLSYEWLIIPKRLLSSLEKKYS